MKRYVGSVNQDGSRRVVIEDERGESRELPLRLDLANKSPTGFAWGYGGSGPAQLSLALLADCLGDDEEALTWYQDFKSHLVATLEEGADWSIGEQDLYALLVCFVRKVSRRPRDEAD